MQMVHYATGFRRGGLSLVAVCLLALTPVLTAAAAHPLAPLPPQNFRGEYDATIDAVVLTWQAPDTAHHYHYRLYRDSILLAEVGGLNYVDADPPETMAVYSIKTVHPEAHESGAQQSIAVHWIVMMCPIVTTGSGGPQVHEECLP